MKENTCICKCAITCVLGAEARQPQVVVHTFHLVCGRVFVVCTCAQEKLLGILLSPVPISPRNTALTDVSYHILLFLWGLRILTLPLHLCGKHFTH